MTSATKPDIWNEIFKKLKTRLLVVLGLLSLWYYGAKGVEELGLFAVNSIDLTHFFRLIVTVAVLVAVPTLFQTPLKCIGFGPPRARDLSTFFSFALLSGGVFALLGFALLGALEFFPTLFGASLPEGSVLERLRYLVKFPELGLFGVLMTIVGLPIMEEIFFRGLLYPHLRREFGVRMAVIASALIFALAHGIEFPISQLIGGIFFALAFEKTGRLWAPIALHILGNGTLYFLMGQIHAT